MDSQLETIFQFFSGLLLVGGITLNYQLATFGSIIPIILSMWFWFQRNINNPIEELKEDIQAFQKDLNTRKEYEELRLKLAIIENEIHKK